MRAVHAVCLSAICLICTLPCAAAARKWRGKGGGGGGAPAAKASASTDYDEVDCQKCMAQVMRLLVPAGRGCQAGNGSLIPSTTSARAPCAYCDTLLPKKRQCVVYSFGVDSVWDFDKAMVSASCRVISYDPFCCGSAHKIGENHDFLPVGMATYDGVAVADAAHLNVTYPVSTLRSLMQSFEHDRIDMLRLKVSTKVEWKGLKNLINLGTVQEIRQLSLNIHFADNDMWEEYKTILTGLKTAGFSPFYVAKQPNAEYLKVQEGMQSLHNRYEVAYGYIY